MFVWTTFWFLEPSHYSSTDEQPLFFLLKHEYSSCCTLTLPLGDEMLTGGISVVLSCGGGCCHSGSGPARRSVWRSGPASITACKNFPFSGSSLSATNFSATCGGGDEVALSSQPEEENPEMESTPLVVSSWILLGLITVKEAAAAFSCCCSNSLSSIRLWQLDWASSLSLMVFVKRPFKCTNCSSFLAISSWAQRIVFSSSKFVYRRECFRYSSVKPCQMQVTN